MIGTGWQKKDEECPECAERPCDRIPDHPEAGLCLVRARKRRQAFLDWAPDFVEGAVLANQEWGTEAQRWMIAEESAETILAMAHYRCGRIDKDDVISEAADGIITSLEAVVLVDGSWERLLVVLDQKLARMRRRIESGDHVRGATS